MTIQRAAQDIGDRFFHVGPRHEHTEDAGDVAAAVQPRPSAFGQGHDKVRNRGWKTAIAGRLACGQGNLAMRFGKSCDRVGQQQNMATLIAKMLCDRHRGPSTSTPDQRRTIRGRGDDHRAFHALGTQCLFNEFTQLAPSLADHGDHDDIGFDTARKIGKQCRFPDARSGEKTDPLTRHQRQQRIKDR